MSTGFDEAPVLVALYVGGDDGETQRLAEALTNQLSSSGRYRLALAEEQAEVAVTITDHVRPIVIRGVDYISYHITFARPGAGELGQSAGRCPARRMEACASRIFRDFRRVLP